jgi:hypothetical protein
MYLLIIKMRVLSLHIQNSFFLWLIFLPLHLSPIVFVVYCFLFCIMSASYCLFMLLLYIVFSFFFIIALTRTTAYHTLTTLIPNIRNILSFNLRGPLLKKMLRELKGRMKTRIADRVRDRDRFIVLGREKGMNIEKELGEKNQQVCLKFCC